MNKQNNITTYGFAIGGGRRILYKLKNLDCCYLVSSNNINHYSDILIHDQPNRILGLGIKSNPVYRIINSKLKQMIKNKEIKSKYIFIDTENGIDLELLDLQLELAK